MKLIKRFLVVGALLASVFVLATPAEAEVRYYNTGYCRWKVDTYYQTHNAPAIAKTETWDLNNGCRWLDADTKYISGGQIKTKYCDYFDANMVNCNVGAVHHQGKGAANEWERGRWDYSGWFG